MTVVVDQHVRLGVHLASEYVLGADHHGEDDDEDDDGDGVVARHRPYATRRNMPAHFPNLRRRDLTWSPHEVQSPSLRHRPRQLEHVR